MSIISLMQQSHHQGIFPGSTRFTLVQSLPVRPGIVPGSQKYICSPITTVHYGLPQSTHVNTPYKSGSSRWTPVSSRWTPVHPGGHPVHPGQHTVDTRFIPVNTRFIPVNTWFITVPYGSLRLIPVNTRLITVHYGALRFIPVNTWFITVPYGSLRFIPVDPRCCYKWNSDSWYCHFVIEELFT